MSGTILFVSLAMNQAKFYMAMDRVLSLRGYRIAHLSFHEGSHQFLRDQGALSYNAFEHGVRMADLENYDLPDVDSLLKHERAAYQIDDIAILRNKFRRHLHAVSIVVAQLRSLYQGKFWVVQELGGFLSVLAAYFEAKRQGIPNIFIEPSFFRGRVFMTWNSLAAPSVTGPLAASVSPEVQAYLSDVVMKQSIVVPMKDRAHYRRPYQKLLDGHNIRRLMGKLKDKYVLRRQEEFQHIAGHVQRHLRMYLNHLRLKSRYRELPDGPFVYFPFHVPADMALTIRSPAFLDQIALVENIAAHVPSNYSVVAKEHPALVGAISARDLGKLLDRCRNLTLLPPEMNNYDVLKRAEAVITVNSKTGAEAILLGKPVVVLGDAFYRDCKLVERATGMSDFAVALGIALDKARPVTPQGERWRYFQDVWDRSVAGELYGMAADNVTIFCESLIAQLREDELRRFSISAAQK